MSTLFYSTLKLSDYSHVFLWGQKSASALLALLSSEARHSNRIALVLSDNAQVYPIEGKVLVSPETGLLKDLLKTESAEVIHLARAVTNDILQPYEFQDMKRILTQMEPPVLPFVYIKQESRALKQMMRKLKAPLCICVINYQQTEQELFDAKMRASVSDKTFNRKISQIINTHCERFNEMDCTENSILFIDQVKTLLEENKLLSILRQFNEQFAGRIFLGNTTQYRIKEI